MTRDETVKHWAHETMIALRDSGRLADHHAESLNDDNEREVEEIVAEIVGMALDAKEAETGR